MKIFYKKFKKCPYCNSKINLKYSGLTDRLETVHGEFNIYECTKCKLAFTNPLPVKNLGILYPTNYLTVKSKKANTLDFERWYRFDQYKFDFGIVKKYISKEINDFGSYLDVGCGSGERVEYVKQNGCKESYGLDKFDNLKSKNKNIFNSNILAFKPKKKYEVVSLFHVLEHIENFEEVIKHIKKNILAENGYLIIQVPNYESLERKIFKDRWFCFDVPRHLWHFNVDFLKAFLENNGLKCLGYKIENAIFHPVSIGASIFKDIDIQRIWVLSKPAHYKILWILVTILTIPFSWIENLLNGSSMLTLVFKLKGKILI